MTAAIRQGTAAPEDMAFKAGTYAIEMEGISKTFGGTQALRDVDLRIQAGEIHGLIGPNGSGKTTLLRVLTGFLTPDTGTITLSGSTHSQGVTPREAAAAGLAQTFQRVALAEELTVAENILLGHDGASIPTPRKMLRHAMTGDRGGLGDAALQELVQILALLGLRSSADTPVAQLPLGHRRRVELARALMASPQVLVLDEPASGLDTHESEEMARILRRVHESRPITLLLVEHDIAVIRALSSRVAVLQLGEIIREGPADDVLSDERVRKAYLGTQA